MCEPAQLMIVSGCFSMPVRIIAVAGVICRPAATRPKPAGTLAARRTLERKPDFMFSLGSPSFVVKRTNSHAKHVYPRSPASAKLMLGLRQNLSLHSQMLLAGIYGEVAELLGKVHQSLPIPGLLWHQNIFWVEDCV